MFPGSPLHIYDPTPASHGRSILLVPPLPPACRLGQLLGSAACRGGARGIGPAQSSWTRAADRSGDYCDGTGRAHPLLASRPAVFDALCSHLDEIETLPPNSQVLAANEVSAVQAIAAQTPGRGSFHGTQYHPEHTLAVSAALVEIRAAELVEEGFGISPSEIVAIAANYRALDAEPTRRDLIWRYGIAREIMVPFAARPRSATGVDRRRAAGSSLSCLPSPVGSVSAPRRATVPGGHADTVV